MNFGAWTTPTPPIMSVRHPESTTMAEPHHIDTQRLRLRRLPSEDAPAMSRILSDPYVAIRIMCDPSTPEKSLEEAVRRIEWFNSFWSSGYGVRGVTIRDSALGDPGKLIGWCGVAGIPPPPPGGVRQPRHV